MFLEASPKYTDSDLNYKRENPNALGRFVEEARSISDYSETKIAINPGFNASTDYTYKSKKNKCTPEKLKRAMFKTSSRGIATALKKE